jgi:uncharacterized protein YecE (DUF72 family)
MKTYIGCSGYHYSGWEKKFYPEDLHKDQWLEFYTKHFNTVEINNTFYKMPTENSLKEWKNKTPANFKFTLKANRYFTHLKKLKIDDDFRNRLNSFTELTGNLEDQLGCILWQLPGNLHKNIPKLEKFCNLLNKDICHVIEFRHQSWFNEKVYIILKEYNISICILSAPGKLPEEVLATSDTAYLRFHGKNDWYNYNYSEEELKNWKKRISSLKEVSQFYAYFNNDQHAYAVDNAKTFSSLF